MPVDWESLKKRADALSSRGDAKMIGADPSSRVKPGSTRMIATLKKMGLTDKEIQEWIRDNSE